MWVVAWINVLQSKFICPLSQGEGWDRDKQPPPPRAWPGAISWDLLLLQASQLIRLCILLLNINNFSEHQHQTRPFWSLWFKTKTRPPCNCVWTKTKHEQCPDHKSDQPFSHPGRYKWLLLLYSLKKCKSQSSPPSFWTGFIKIPKHRITPISQSMRSKASPRLFILSLKPPNTSLNLCFLT